VNTGKSTFLSVGFIVWQIGDLDSDHRVCRHNAGAKLIRMSQSALFVMHETRLTKVTSFTGILPVSIFFVISSDSGRQAGIIGHRRSVTYAEVAALTRGIIIKHSANCGKQLNMVLRRYDIRIFKKNRTAQFTLFHLGGSSPL
jgi:hypothetical protein